MFTFGFYNSLGGDRKYNAVQISRLFEGIINDGVFASIGDSLMVTPGAGGMTVNVGTGRAWFNNTWNDNDAVMPITLDPSEAVLNRIDAIVLEVQDAPDVRTNSIKKIKGTPASVPVPPTMINMTGHHQYPLAYIYVGAGVTEITADNITNKVGTVDCPFVTVVGLDALLPEWQEQFEVWFDNLQEQMTGDVATNLQNQITANLNTEKANKTKYGTCSTAADTAEKVVVQPDFSLVAGVILVVKFTNVNSADNPTLNVNGTGAKAIYLNGAAVPASYIPKMAVFQYDGTYYQLLNPAVPSGVVPVANGGTGSTTGAAAIAALGIDVAIANADKLAQRDSYMAWCANVNTNSLDCAFGKNNEDLMFGIGMQLAMYAWFKGDSKVTYPFNTLKTKQTFLECYSQAYTEIRANHKLLELIAASPYAKAACVYYIPYSGDIPTALSTFDFKTFAEARGPDSLYATTTIPASGYYKIQVAGSTRTSGGMGSFNVNVNGSSIGTFSFYSSFSVSDKYLNAGDVVTVTGSNVSMFGTMTPLIISATRPIVYPTTPTAGNRIIQFSFATKWQPRTNKWTVGAFQTVYTFAAVPKTGTYRVQYYYGIWEEDSTVYFGEQLILQVRVNGAVVHQVGPGLPNQLTWPTQVIADINCNAGDVITVGYTCTAEWMAAVCMYGATLSIDASDNYPA